MAAKKRRRQPVNKKWTAQKKAAMRRQVKEGRATKTELARRHNTTRQNIDRLLGPISKPPADKGLAKASIDHRRQVVWTPERILEKARKWQELYGSLTTTDWNPGYLVKAGYLHLAERYYDFGGPHYGTALKCFGTWPEMLKQAGISPDEAKRSKRRMARTAKPRKSTNSWRGQ